MSSNLCQDNCDCGYIFCLKDFRGKPIEFRQYGDYVPRPGVKLVCPTCGKVYFGWIRQEDEFWSEPSDCAQDVLTYPGGHQFPNRYKGKFAKKIKVGGMLNKSGKDEELWVHLGYYTIDLSYYETGRDEGVGIDDDSPSYLFTADDHPLTRMENHRDRS